MFSYSQLMLLQDNAAVIKRWHLPNRYSPSRRFHVSTD